MALTVLQVIVTISGKAKDLAAIISFSKSA
jgi:hypothetical protein